MSLWKFWRGEWVECDAPAAQAEADNGVAPQDDSQDDPDAHAANGWVWRRPPPRHWMKVYVHLPQLVLGVPRFDLVPKLIGRKGKNMKNINNVTGDYSVKHCQKLEHHESSSVPCAYVQPCSILRV
jgi:hypothetical protein